MQNNSKKNQNNAKSSNPLQFPHHHPNFPMPMFIPGAVPSTSATPFPFMPLQNAVYQNGMGAFWNPAVLQNFAMLNQKAMNMMLPQGTWAPNFPVASPSEKTAATVSPSLSNSSPSPATSQVEPESEPEPIVKSPTRESTPPVDVISVSPAAIPAAPSEKSVERSSISRFDYDEGNDDVDNMFGISFPEEELSPKSSVESGGEKCLSPISFTPPDSPQHHLSFDEMFGIGSTVKHKTTTPTTKTKTPDLPKSSGSSTSKSAIDYSKMNEEEFLKSYVQPKKIPIYKQKAALLSLAEESKKKKGPNYDVFDFNLADEEDRFVQGSPAEKMEKVEKETVPVPKSVYISGIGFEVKNEKDGISKKTQVKQTDNKTEGLSDRPYISLADNIRIDRDLRMSCSLLKIMELSDTDCAKNKRIITSEEPLLPKFTIKIDQLTPINNNNKRKRIGKKRRSNESISDDEDVKINKMTPKVYSIRRTDGTPSRPSALNFLGVPEDEKRKLDMFGPADGILPKEAYLVCKTDILKWDCPIWKVDHEKMLRKFTPHRFRSTGKLVYASSTTYSGWCETIKYKYFRVSVRIVKSTRYEIVVEPEIPLNEVFCAYAMEWFRDPRCFLIEESNTKKFNPDFLKEPRQKALHTFLNICLEQVLTRDFVKSLRDKNDWSYTHSIAEIEKNNKQCEDLIQKRLQMNLKLKRCIGTYTRLVISKSSYYSLTKCQICNSEKSQNILNFFDKTEYDLNLIVDTSNTENQDPVVVNVISCDRCSMSIDYLHKMHHLQFHILRICEDKLEEIGTTEVDLTVKELIRMAKADEAWTFSVIQKYCDVWDRVNKEFNI